LIKTRLIASFLVLGDNYESKIYSFKTNGYEYFHHFVLVDKAVIGYFITLGVLIIPKAIGVAARRQRNSAP
tara:strand:+ start:541 stop:753 length:213 start_codon:yes stop_codon:yes gene_type:complete